MEVTVKTIGGTMFRDPNVTFERRGVTVAHGDGTASWVPYRAIDSMTQARR